MLKLLLLISCLIFSFGLDAKTLCDEKSKKCQEVGSAASWLLSIIETSVEPCADPRIGAWLEKNNWLTNQVKESYSEYADLKQMQTMAFWAPENPDRKEHCLKVKKLVASPNPLNQEMR